MGIHCMRNQLERHCRRHRCSMERTVYPWMFVSVLFSPRSINCHCGRRNTTTSLSVLVTLLAEASHEPASASWVPSALLPVVFVVVVAVARVAVVSWGVIDDDDDDFTAGALYQEVSSMMMSQWGRWWSCSPPLRLISSEYEHRQAPWSTDLDRIFSSLGQRWIDEWVISLERDEQAIWGVNITHLPDPWQLNHVKQWNKRRYDLNNNEIIK